MRSLDATVCFSTSILGQLNCLAGFTKNIFLNWNRGVFTMNIDCPFRLRPYHCMALDWSKVGGLEHESSELSCSKIKWLQNFCVSVTSKVENFFLIIIHIKLIVCLYYHVLQSDWWQQMSCNKKFFKNHEAMKFVIATFASFVPIQWNFGPVWNKSCNTVIQIKRMS